jgi:hypothetical protein
MIDFNLIRTLFVGKKLPVGVQFASHEALPAAGLTMGTLYLGRPGSGKTSALARHIVDDFFAHPDQAIFVLDKSGDATNKILALIGQRSSAEQAAARKRLVYEELGHPDWVLPLPELSLDYGGDYEDEIGRVRANLDGLFENPSLEARILAGVAINKTLPEILRVLVTVRNQYGETWQVTEVERLLGNLDRLKAVVHNRRADLRETTYDYLTNRLVQLRSQVGEMRTYILTELFEGVHGNYMQARLGYFKPVWTPKGAIAKGQMVIIDGSRLINQPKALDYAFVQVYSLVKAEINRRQPADPHDKPVSLVLDETKKLFDTPTFAREIGEISPLYRSRKLQLYVVLQGLFQLNADLKEQVWSMGNIVAFALENKADAEQVAYQLFHYNPTQEKLPAKTTTQNATAEPETGQDRQVADWIHALGFRQCLVRRYLSEQRADPYVRYVNRTKSWPQTVESADRVKVRVRDFKDELLKLRGVPVRQALEIVHARKIEVSPLSDGGPRQL